TEETEPAAEETEAAAAAAAAAGADAPEADTPEPSAEEAPAPTPRRRRRKAAEPAAEETPAPALAPVAEASDDAPADPDLVAAEEARAILSLTPRAIARDWSKLLESAVANAEHNHELVGEDLYVKAVHADEGPTIKRFRPRAMGRATRIRKRTSHLTILLTPKE